MKQTLRISFLTATLLWSGVLAFAQPTLENIIEPKINGVTLDSSYSTVIRQLGKPVQKKQGKSFYSGCSESRVTPLTLRYAGLVIELLGDGKGRNFKVIRIELASSKWTIASGISLGASIKAVRAKFGEPARIENEFGARILTYFHKAEGGASFHFRSNKLIKVEMALDLC